MYTVSYIGTHTQVKSFLIRAIIIFFILFWVEKIHAQDYFEPSFKRHRSYIYDPNIASLQIYRKAWPLSYPIIQMNTSEQIEIRFDDLSARVRNFSYKLSHCTADYTPSDLSSTEFMQGFNENTLMEYAFSSNTTVSYVHYRLEFPNENVKFTLSGNYLLSIYEDFNPDRLILTALFFVSEQQVQLQARVKRAAIVKYNQSHQELEVEVNDYNHILTNGHTDLLITASQNARYAESRYLHQPRFITGQVYSYFFSENDLFEGHREYLHFDTKSIRFAEMRTDSVWYDADGYHFTLYPDAFTPWKNPSQLTDMNGMAFYDREQSRNRYTDADYVWVHFRVPARQPFTSEQLYLLGQWNFYEKSHAHRMQFNRNLPGYELKLQLKQGYYNYNYYTLPIGSDRLSTELTTGNSHQTENDYIVKVYQYMPMQQTHRLIAYKIVNSVKENK